MGVDSQQSHAGWPSRHQRVLRRGNLAVERQFASEDVLFPEGFRSMIRVPLVVKGKSIGAYCISSLEAEADFLRPGGRPDCAGGREHEGLPLPQAGYDKPLSSVSVQP